MMNSTRPNVVYIHSHDTGRWVEPYGWPISMPVYSRFARSGLMLRNMHCAGPTCSPSRAGLLTGMNPHSAGMIGLAHRGFALRDVRTHIVHTLHQAGYTSMLCGIQHVMPTSAAIGYSEVLTDRHAAVFPTVIERLGRPMPEPFFLDVGLFETHRPFPAAADDQDPRYQPATGILPDTPDMRQDVAAYNTMARVLDQKVGLVLEALDQAGLAGRTIVIITTDHGPAFPLMKCNLTAQGTGVLFMMRGPGIPAGTVSDVLLSQIDVFPTLCDLLDFPKPSWLEGRSFAAVAQDRPDAGDPEVFAEVTYHAAYEPQRAIRTPTHCYIRRYGGRAQPVLSNCDQGFAKTIMLATNWPATRLAREELYDLVADPLERMNLAGDPAHRAVLDGLRGRLDAWMVRTSDPLLAGYVAAPEGALVCAQDAAAPQEGTFRVGPGHAGGPAIAP